MPVCAHTVKKRGTQERGGWSQGQNLGIKPAKHGEKESVARHAEEHTRLAQERREGGDGSGQQRAHSHDDGSPVPAVHGEGKRQRCLVDLIRRGGVSVAERDKVVPRHHAVQNHGDSRVHAAGNEQGADDTNWQVAARIAGLFRQRGNRVKAQVGEEKDACDE